MSALVFFSIKHVTQSIDNRLERTDSSYLKFVQDNSLKVFFCFLNSQTFPRDATHIFFRTGNTASLGLYRRYGVYTNYAMLFRGVTWIIPLVKTKKSQPFSK